MCFILNERTARKCYLFSDGIQRFFFFHLFHSFISLSLNLVNIILGWTELSLPLFVFVGKFRNIFIVFFSLHLNCVTCMPTKRSEKIFGCVNSFIVVKITWKMLHTFRHFLTLPSFNLCHNLSTSGTKALFVYILLLYKYFFCRALFHSLLFIRTCIFFVVFLFCTVITKYVWTTSEQKHTSHTKFTLK